MVVRRRLLGLLMVGVLAGAFILTLGLYNKWFQSTVPVTLRSATIGNQLIVPADVKLRGVIVGRVSTVSSNGSDAVLHLDLDPGQVDVIPANVEARILPKTLFGEKYVQLVYPSHPATQHIQAGDVIPEDHSAAATELQTVFRKLVPLLRSLQPEQLSLTLTNLADAVRGRGEALGQNLELVDRFFSQLNPHLPALQHDISALSEVASSYADAAPDLLEQARNFAANAKTITQKQDVYANFLRGSLGFANETTRLLNTSGNDMIRLAQTSRPITDTLAYYSPELTCFVNGLANLEPRLNSAFGPGPYLHITLEFTPQRQGYTYPKDKPSYDTIAAPNCYGLPNDPKSSAYPSVYSSPAPPNATRSSYAPLAIGEVGSADEQRLIAALVAPTMGVSSADVPRGLADLLFGPMMRGAVVGYQ